MIPETQRESWDKTQECLGDKQARVFTEIRNARYGLTLFQLVGGLGWPINSVSGRVTELRKLGKIVDSGERRLNPETHKRAVVWIVDDRAQGQIDLRWE